MNRCRSCEREFGYWEVCRSWWTLRLRPRITCVSCGERNPTAMFGWLSGGCVGWIPLLVMIFVPQVSAFVEGLFLSVDHLLVRTILAVLVVYVPLYLLLTLLFSLFPVYGRKPKDVKH